MTENLTLDQARQKIRLRAGEFYVYILFRPCGSPFYVGCGRSRGGIGQRIGFHEKDARRGTKSHKCNAIRAIWAGGNHVRYAVESWHPDEASMFRREVELISEIGRADLGSGPLTNWSAGGDGLVGRAEIVRQRASMSMRAIDSAQRRQQTSERMKKLWQSPEFRARRAAAMADPAIVDKLRDGVARGSAKRRGKSNAKVKALWSDRAYIEKQGTALRAALRSDEYRKKRSAISNAMWADPEFRAKMAKSQSKRREREQQARAST